jgi:hypothetical protein
MVLPDRHYNRGMSTLPSKTQISIPSHYTIGDRLDWAAPWIDVELWVELPFWLMVENAAIQVQLEGHTFPIAIHDNYFNLYADEVTDSQSTVLYRGPKKNQEELPKQLRDAIIQKPDARLMWRKSKTYLKVGTRCNEDVWNAAGTKEIPRTNEVRRYLSDLCRAHIPVISKLIQAYRLATYDYFAYEVAPWDVPTGLSITMEAGSHTKDDAACYYLILKNIGSNWRTLRPIDSPVKTPKKLSPLEVNPS